MGYAGIQLQLLTSMTQKAETEYKMMSRQTTLHNVQKESTDCAKYYANELARFAEENGCDSTDEAYKDYKEQLNTEKEIQMADLQNWEEELELENDKDNAKLSMLNTNIQNLTSMLQKNIATAHTYGGVSGS